MVKTYKVYSWGANNSGQLGLGHLNDTIAPQKCCELDKLPNKISAGGGHSFILESRHKLWACGLNDKGQLGIGTFANESNWKCLELAQNFISVVCGWDFTIALNSNGQILGTGSNAHGQLLKQKSIRSCNEFCKIEPLNQPGKVYNQIAAGLRHAAAIDLDGVVYCWGSNNHGQLGPAKETWNEEPVQVVLPYAANSISCGENFTAVVLSRGEIWFWGNGKHIKSGVKNMVPQKLFDKHYLDGILHSGWNHLIIHHVDKLYSIGRHDYGQLGLKAHNQEFNEIELKDVSHLSCGSQYNLAIAGGSLATWGWNEHGSCGNNSEIDVFLPTFINDFPGCLQIGSGAGCSFCVTC